MKNILFATLLVTISLIASAEPRSRKIQMMCGSLEDVQMTMEKYGEKLVMASLAPNKETANLLYVNFETQTTSWFIHNMNTDEYCMVGVGDNVLIPKDSPLNIGTGIGKKTLFK